MGELSDEQKQFVAIVLRGNADVLSRTLAKFSRDMSNELTQKKIAQIERLLEIANLLWPEPDAVEVSHVKH